MRWLRYILKNPLFLFLPIVGILLLGWQYYVDAQLPVNSSSVNILPNAGMDTVDDSGMPIGWQFTGGPGSSVASEAGYRSPKLIVMRNENTNPKQGATLASPLASIGENRRYIYKGFYKSSSSFELIMRTSSADGSFRQSIVGRHTPSEEWTTASHVFTGPSGAQTVQFIYNFYQKGELRIDNVYLEADPEDAHFPASPDAKNNLILNPALDTGGGDAPRNWRAVSHGTNELASLLRSEKGEGYLRTTIGQYASGEAAWQPDSVAVRENQAMRFNVSYRSDNLAYVAAEYTLQSGERQFADLDRLFPAANWTVASINFETPPNTIAVAVSVMLRSEGTLDARDYGLYDIAKPGAATWSRPFVSFTFDDGWKSSYASGAPLLEEAGYRGTYYVNPASIDTAKFISSTEALELRKRGHELASHGHEHYDMTILDRSAIGYQLQHAYEYFREVHGDREVNFATPYGRNDAQVIHHAQKYYTSHRGTVSGINTRQNFDPYALLAFYVRSDTTLEHLTQVLEEAKAKNGWLILVYHRVQDESDDQNTVGLEQFRHHIEAVKKSGAQVSTVADVLEKVHAR